MSHRTLSSTALILVFSTALLVRLFFCAGHQFESQRISTPDSRVYLELARNLSEEGRFVRGEGFSLENPVEPETFRTPGYPLLVLLCTTLPGDGLVLLVLLQILLGSAVAVGGAWVAGQTDFSFIILISLKIATICTKGFSSWPLVYVPCN